jgi:aspartokinase
MIKDQMTQEKKVRALLKRAKIRLRNKMMVAIVEKPTDFERVYDLQKRIKRDRGDFHLIEGEEVLTLISNSDYVSDLKEAFRGKIKKVTEDLAQLTMVFDEKIETTPGVVSFIYGLLADNSINVWEEMSCWTDLMVIIEEKDAARAMHVLSLDTVAA